MSLGEVKLIVLAALGLLLLGGGAYVGHHLTAQHYQLLAERDKEAREAVVAAQQATIIALQNERAAKLAQEELDHATRAKADADLRGAIDDRMRGLTTSLRAFTVSPAVATPAGGLGAAAGAGSGGAVQPSRAELDAAFAEFSAASDNLIGACQHDSLEIIGALSVQPKGNP